jgi:hypothetical protein
MRSTSAHDREGNNYRYHRHINREKELEERKALAKKWDDYYKKVGISDKKHKD